MYSSSIGWSPAMASVTMVCPLSTCWTKSPCLGLAFRHSASPAPAGLLQPRHPVSPHAVAVFSLCSQSLLVKHLVVTWSSVQFLPEELSLCSKVELIPLSLLPQSFAHHICLTSYWANPARACMTCPHSPLQPQGWGLCRPPEST